jgi:DNA-binding MarR family transcriptional regulator
MMNTSDLLDLLTDTTRLHTTYVERQVAQLGIHSGQGSLLSALDMLGPCSQRELADFRQVSPATISVMLGRLESRGLIRRAPSGEGGKRNQIFLTQAGKDMARALRDLMPQEADKVFAGLTDEELSVAERVFRTICDNLKSSC